MKGPSGWSRSLPWAQMKLGTYGGNDSSQSITGLGFSPEYVIVISGAGHEPVHRSASKALLRELVDLKGRHERLGDAVLAAHLDEGNGGTAAIGWPRHYSRTAQTAMAPLRWTHASSSTEPFLMELTSNALKMMWGIRTRHLRPSFGTIRPRF